MVKKEKIYTHMAIPTVNPDYPNKCPGKRLNSFGNFVACEGSLTDAKRKEIQTDSYPGARVLVFVCKHCHSMVFPFDRKWNIPYLGEIVYGHGIYRDHCPRCKKNNNETTTFSIQTISGQKNGIFCQNCHKLFFVS